MSFSEILAAQVEGGMASVKEALADPRVVQLAKECGIDLNDPRRMERLLTTASQTLKANTLAKHGLPAEPEAALQPQLSAAPTVLRQPQKPLYSVHQAIRAYQMFAEME